MENKKYNLINPEGERLVNNYTPSAIQEKISRTPVKMLDALNEGLNIVGMPEIESIIENYVLSVNYQEEFGKQLSSALSDMAQVEGSEIGSAERQKQMKKIAKDFAEFYSRY